MSETIPVGYQPSKRILLEEVEKTLLYFSTSIFGQDTEEEIVWDLAKNCISQLGFVDCVVYLLDPDTQVLKQKAAFGPKNPRDYQIYHPIEIELGKGIVGQVALKGSPEIVNNTANDPRYIVDDEVRLSEMAVPIVYKDGVLGVIDSEHPDKDFFTSQHLRILTTISALCANKIIKTRTQQRAQQMQKQLVDTELKIADLKLQALRAQMNPHFMFNALNAIQHFITTNEQRIALKYLSRFSRLVRCILANADRERLTLFEEMDLVERYLELENLRYNQKFTYKIKVYQELDLHSLYVPAQLIQSFAEQAVGQSLIKKIGKGHLEIGLCLKDEYLICTLEDDGVLRSGAPVDQTRKATGYHSPGLSFINRKVALINRDQTQIEISSENVPGDIGTKVEIRLAPVLTRLDFSG